MGILGNIFGPDSARWITRSIYKSQLKYLTEHNVEGAHNQALANALESRYKARGKSISELLIYADVLPFPYMHPTIAIETLGEYVLYQEYPLHTNVQHLQREINQAIGLITDPDGQNLLVGCYSFKPRWTLLLYQSTSDQINSIMTKLIQAT
jgi:hypothetical protein